MARVKNDVTEAIKALNTLLEIGRKGFNVEPSEVKDSEALASALATATGGSFDVVSMAADFLEDRNSHTSACILRQLRDGNAVRKGQKVTITLPDYCKGPDTIVVDG